MIDGRLEHSEAGMGHVGGHESFHAGEGAGAQEMDLLSAMGLDAGKT